eukprot:TRINITY_DN12104_c0_g1_i1.p1 TRINITY_DN12104_c0_g1~~TRINITY_DN12104_c0_g1_i1.p1  ORF type:complete len:613 (-),score=143.46 TRINITY_DN12104_c0_g1_i1:227-2065(-)
MEDDEGVQEEVQTGELQHMPDVYSFFNFVVPLKSVQNQRGSLAKGKSTTTFTLAYTLVIMAIVMQVVVVYAIFHEVVMKQISWQKSVVEIGEVVSVDGLDWNLFAPTEKCADASSLCTWVDGIYTCAPPSVQLLSRWKELDRNGDGMWAFEEALQGQEDLMCKYGVDPVEVFRFFVKILHQRADLLWIHEDVRDHGYIHEAYFSYLIGDVGMCVYRTPDMCPNLLKRGYFESALREGSSPRVGNTTTSALDFCRGLLEPGGICEQLLPSTYWVWKTETVKQCQGADYARFAYEHPRSGFVTSLLEVDYKARETYALFQSPLFVAYKSIIVFMWFLTMLAEVKIVLKVSDWVFGFKRGEHEVDESMTEIKSVGLSHFAASVVLLLVRIVVCAVLVVVGTQFLLKSKTYVEQLFDAVAMLFVLQFTGVLHDNAVNAELREEVAALKPMTYRRKVYVRTIADNKTLGDIIWLLVLFAMTMTVMRYNHVSVVVPVYDALSCTCVQAGEHCHEAKAFDAEFWQHYWAVTIPKVFQAVDTLRVGGRPAAGFAAHPQAAMLQTGMRNLSSKVSDAAAAAAAAAAAPASLVGQHATTARHPLRQRRMEKQNVARSLLRQR